MIVFVSPKTKRAADLVRGNVVVDRRHPGAPGAVAEVVTTTTLDGVQIADVRLRGSDFAYQWSAEALVEVEGA